MKIAIAFAFVFSLSAPVLAQGLLGVETQQEPANAVLDRDIAAFEEAWVRYVALQRLPRLSDELFQDLLRVQRQREQAQRNSVVLILGMIDQPGGAAAFDRFARSMVRYQEALGQPTREVVSYERLKGPYRLAAPDTGMCALVRLRFRAPGANEIVTEDCWLRLTTESWNRMQQDPRDGKA